jgi:hypothetical protein
LQEPGPAGTADFCPARHPTRSAAKFRAIEPGTAERRSCDGAALHVCPPPKLWTGRPQSRVPRATRMNPDTAPSQRVPCRGC